MKKTIISILLICLISPILWAVSPHDFKYKKSLAGEMGVGRIIVDQDLFSKMNVTFTNMVLIDNNNTIVPFHIRQNKDLQTDYFLKNWKTQENVTDNVFEIHVQSPNIPLEGFSIFSSSLPKSSFVIVSYPEQDIVTIKLTLPKKQPSTKAQLPFYKTIQSKAYLIQFKPNHPFKIQKILAHGPEYELLFKAKTNGDHHLYYGSHKTANPQQIHQPELDLFKNEQLKNWHLGTEMENPLYVNLKKNPLWKNGRFWLVITAIPLLCLLWIGGRFLKKRKVS